MVGASAAAPHDNGQASGVQEHRGKRKGHEEHWRQGGNKADGGLGVALPGEQGPTDLLGASEVGDIRAVPALRAGAQGAGQEEKTVESIQNREAKAKRGSFESTRVRGRLRL
jgi:hypothetical protein